MRLFQRGGAQSLREEVDRLAEFPATLEAMRGAEPIRSYTVGEHRNSLEAIYEDAVRGGPRPVDEEYHNPFDLSEWRERAARLRRLLSQG